MSNLFFKWLESKEYIKYNIEKYKKEYNIINL